MRRRGRAIHPLDLALILGSVILGSFGQTLMRLGMAGLGGQGLLSTVSSGIFRPEVLAGLACYVVSTLLWLAVLSRVALSVAYPFGALNYVLVVAAALVAGESVGALRWLGVLLIVGGMMLITTGAEEPA